MRAPVRPRKPSKPRRPYRPSKPKGPGKTGKVAKSQSYWGEAWNEEGLGIQDMLNCLGQQQVTFEKNGVKVKITNKGFYWTLPDNKKGTAVERKADTAYKQRLKNYKSSMTRYENNKENYSKKMKEYQKKLKKWAYDKAAYEKWKAEEKFRKAKMELG